MVTRFQVCDIATNLDHDSSRFMAQYAGEIGVVLPFEKMKIAMAESGGCYLDEDFARTGICDLQIDDFQRSGNLKLNGCAHTFDCSSLTTDCAELYASRASHPRPQTGSMSMMFRLPRRCCFARI